MESGAQKISLDSLQTFVSLHVDSRTCSSIIQSFFYLGRD